MGTQREGGVLGEYEGNLKLCKGRGGVSGCYRAFEDQGKEEKRPSSVMFHSSLASKQLVISIIYKPGVISFIVPKLLVSPNLN